MKIDHLIYGTLPDTPGSQHVIAKSPGVSSALEAWLINYYDQFGDCRNESFAKSLSVCWYREQAGNERAVISQVSHHGKDFSGRWGALLRHSAILPSEQYGLLGFEPDRLERHLVSSGTSDQLAALTELVFDSPESDLDSISESVLSGAISFDEYRNNLSALMKGLRLVLYAECNTDHSNQYLRNLVGLLPLRCRQVLNWSEFVFRTSEELDVSLVHSSRYEAPSEGRLAFTEVGENHIRNLNLSDEYADDYMSRLAIAMAEQDPQQFAALRRDS